jgi:O-antigen/teichoic acid export membrane protein
MRDMILYGGASAVSKSLFIFTFPLLARHLSIEDYGVLDYFLVLGSLISIFFIFGQDSAVARYFYEYEKITTRQQLISQSLIFQLSCMFLIIPLLWLGSDYFAYTLNISDDIIFLFKILLIQLPFMVIINFSQNILKWTFDRFKFLTISLGFTIAQACLLVMAVKFFNVGIAGVLVVNLVSSILFGILGIFFIRKYIVCPKNFVLLREMLPFAIPYGFICVCGAFSPTMERMLTDTLLGTESLGFYAAGTKIAMLIGLLLSAFQIAWGPFSLSIYKQENSGQTYNWVFKLFALAACLAALLLTLFAQPLIIFFTTDRYLEAVIVVFPLSMALAIQSISWITEIGIGFSKRSYISLYAYGFGILVTLSGILLLTPFFGLLGVGLGVLLGQIAKAVFASWLAQRSFPLPWQYVPVVFLITLTLVSGFTSIWIGEYFGSFFSNLLLVGAILLVMLAGWFILLSQTERNQIKSNITLLLA